MPPNGLAIISYHCPLLHITVPSFPSRSPPSHHCLLLPITVPSFPSLSPPSHHCPPPSHYCLPPSQHCPHHSPLLHITACPLLPITVPSSPSLFLTVSTVPSIMLSYPGRLYFPHWYCILRVFSPPPPPPLPPIWSVKNNSS